MTPKEVEREKTKLRATFLNSLAVGIFTAGVLSPIVALAVREDSKPHSLPLSVMIAFLCFAASFVLHLRAVEHLEELGK